MAEDVVDDIEEGLASRGRWRGDLTLSSAVGSTVARTEAFHIFHPESGAPLGTVWVAQDVTGLMTAERALRAANVDLLRFKALVEACPEFIAIAALDGTVLYVNPPGRAMVGMDPDVDVSATRISDYLTEEGLELSLTVEQPAVIANGFWEGESTLRDLRGGRAIPVQIASFLIRDPESDEPFALATVQRDLSDRVAAEEALRELAEQRKLLLSRLVDAQDAERAHIAAEVHDDSVQALAAVDLRLGLLSRRITAEAPHLLEYVDPLRATVSEATDRLRTLLFDLTPVDLDHGLAPALRETAREIFDGSTTEVTRRRAGRRCRVRRSALGPAGGPPDRQGGALQRPQARPGRPRHAHPALARRRPRAERRRRRHRHPGRPDLVGRRSPRAVEHADRAQIAGGEWSVARRPEGGTEVSLWLPPDPAEDAPVKRPGRSPQHE